MSAPNLPMIVVSRIPVHVFLSSFSQGRGQVRPSHPPPCASLGLGTVVAASQPQGMHMWHTDMHAHGSTREGTGQTGLLLWRRVLELESGGPRKEHIVSH